ncbi:hypothetical protein KDD30_23295 (plasmid) [Photobacterium sp. GJ3]|uniref:hypothetical protein n=1 Tax=Photobacterium sp. GJ3 TaxID=2829502 RepID=UPI001B8D14C8|nr:hypothetical protein [Photobacterium sp. GJ3]QUJ69658.1 hypothetical protein KDD30_23295 [Photobacterium sp. GJ3]
MVLAESCSEIFPDGKSDAGFGIDQSQITHPVAFTSALMPLTLRDVWLESPGIQCTGGNLAHLQYVAFYDSVSYSVSAGLSDRF